MLVRLKNKRPNWCHLLFYFTSYVLNIFRTLILYIHHKELATILFNYHIGRIVLGSMCVGVSVWLGWSGIRVTGFYFTSYVFSMFRTLIYPSSGACDYSVELPHWSYCSWFDVCCSFGLVGLEWYPCYRLLFHFLCVQHVSDINISIIRSLRLFCLITTLVVLFLVRCVLEFRFGWVGVVSVLQAFISLLMFSACFGH